VVRRGGITFAVSTSGASPAMARWLRRRLEAQFPEHYAEVLQVVARVRDRLRREGVRVKPERWQEALDGELISLVARGDGAAAEERLLQMLGKEGEG